MEYNSIILLYTTVVITPQMKRYKIKIGLRMVNEHAMHHVALKAGASNFFSSIMPHNF